MKRRLLVVGGVAAGMSAAAKAKREDPELEVVAFEKSGFVSYGACGLPYYIAGEVPRVEDLVARTPEQFKKQGITAKTRHEVVAVDLDAREAVVADLEEGREFKEPFDVLVVATGARPILPPLVGTDLPGVFTLRTPEDGVAIREWALKSKRAVVVGAGYVGLELSEAFRALGLEVTLLEARERVLPHLDPEVSELVAAELGKNGVRVETGAEVKAVLGEGRVEGVETAAGKIEADLVLFAVGIRPNTALAEAMGLLLGPTGAVKVDAKMRTNVEGVFAAGDVAESRHLLTGEPFWAPLGDVANKHGRTAGSVIAGKEAEFRGVLGTTITRVFGLAVAATGLTETAAREKGFAAKGVMIKSRDRAHYMPGGHPLFVKLVYEEKEGRVLGAQVVGHRNDARRVDVVAALIQMGASVEDMRALDLAYAPPFGPVWDPLLVAANQAR